MSLFSQLPKIAPLVAATLLGGYTGSDALADTRVSVILATDENAFVKGALDSAIDTFTGGGTSSHPVGQIPSDFLDTTSSRATPYTQPRSALVGARFTWQHPINTRTAWLASAQASYGISDYLLPKGAGVLTQPIAITFRTTSLDLAGGVRQRMWDGSLFDLDVEGKAGVLFTHTRTAINSPVLRVRHTDWQTLHYASVALVARPDLGRPNGPRPVGRIELRGYPHVGARISAEIGLEF